MADQRTTAERLALALTEGGMQRMPARVLSAFLFTDRPSLTMGELAGELGVSAGSVSDAVRMLSTVGLIERVPSPGSRRDHYRMRQDAWPTLFSKQNAIVRVMLEAAEDGVAATTAQSPARHRLVQMRDFYEFMLRELPALVARWDEQRDPDSPGTS